MLWMLTSSNFSLPLDECIEIRNDLANTNTDLVSILMTNETGSFHNGTQLNGLFNCLYPSGSDPFGDGFIFFFDRFEDLLIRENRHSVASALCTPRKFLLFLLSSVLPTYAHRQRTIQPFLPLLQPSRVSLLPYLLLDSFAPVSMLLPM